MNAKDALYLTSYTYHAKIERELAILEDYGDVLADRIFLPYLRGYEHPEDSGRIKQAARNLFRQAAYVLKLQEDVRLANEWLNS